MLKKISFIILGFLVFSLFGFYGYREFNTNILYDEANYIANFDDLNKVSGFAENIFVAQVVKNLGAYDNGESGIYETSFQVEVLLNIKGKINKKIDIVQMAGYDELGNMHLPQNTEYLEEGNLYLFSTAGDSPTRILSHENGSHLLATKAQIEQRLAESPSNSLKKVEKDIIRESDIVEEFRQAYKNEVYYEENEDGKYKISTEKNAYKNLSESEKQALEDPESGFVE